MQRDERGRGNALRRGVQRIRTVILHELIERELLGFFLLGSCLFYETVSECLPPPEPLDHGVCRTHDCAF